MENLAGSSLLKGWRLLEELAEPQQGRWPRFTSSSSSFHNACHIPEQSGTHVPLRAQSSSISSCSSWATATQGPQLQGLSRGLAGARGRLRGVARGLEDLGAAGAPRFLREPLGCTPGRLRLFAVLVCRLRGCQWPTAHQTATAANSRTSTITGTTPSHMAPARPIATALAAAGAGPCYIATAR